MIQVYPATATDFTKNGLPLTPTEAYTESELNGTWSATLIHPIDADGRWEQLTEQAIVKMPSWNGDQLYRIVNRVKEDTFVICTMYPIFFDAMNEVFLVDVRPTDKTGQQALNIMLQNSDKFSAQSNIQATATAYYECKNFLEALAGEEENCFIRRWGGEIEYDNLVVKVNDHLGSDRGLAMRYGLNIQSISEEVDMGGVVTRVYPKAYNGRTLSSPGYVDSPLKTNYPTLRIGTVTFEHIKLAADATTDDASNPNVIICQNQSELNTALTAAVNAEYNAGLDKPIMNLTITGVFDLSKFRGFEDWGTQQIGLGDTIHVTHSKLNITTDARIIYVRYDSIRKMVSDVQIGSKPYNFFEASSDLQAQVESGALKGDPGDSVYAIYFEYCQASANTIPAGGSFEDIQITEWSEDLPNYVAGRFYWMRTVTVMKSGTIYYSDPLFDMSDQLAGEASAAAATAVSAATSAEGIASAAAQVANQKRRVFLAQPTTPYDAGDLYFDSPHSTTYVCTTSRATGSYDASDWTVYSTDVSNHFWYDSSGAHVADVQGDVTRGNAQTISSAGTVMTRNGKLVTSWTGSSSSDAAVNFYDCSGKCFYAQPTVPYAKGDLWLDGDTLKICKNAKNETQSYSASDWTTYNHSYETHLLASYGAAGITQYVHGLLAMALTASGMSIYGIDTQNHESITEAIFGKNGAELYANGVKRMALTTTGGLTFYDTDGSTVVGSFKGSEIELNAVNGTKTNNIQMGSIGVRIRSTDTSSDVEMRLNNGNLRLLKNGIEYGALQRYTLGGDPMLGVVSDAGFDIHAAKLFFNESRVDIEHMMTCDNTITNLNVAMPTGLYRYASDATGVPNSAGGTLLNLHRSDTYAAQFAFPNSSTGNQVYYVRKAYPVNDAIAWTAWHNVIIDDDLTTAITAAVATRMLVSSIAETSGSGLRQDLPTGLYTYTASADATPTNAGGWCLALRYSDAFSLRVAFPNNTNGDFSMWVCMKHPSGDGTAYTTWRQVI